MSPAREVRVRLRSKFAALYPELAPDVWVPAGEFAQVIVAQARQARLQSVHRRTLDPRHFEWEASATHGQARGREWASEVDPRGAQGGAPRSRL